MLLLLKVVLAEVVFLERDELDGVDGVPLAFFFVLIGGLEGICLLRAKVVHFRRLLVLHPGAAVLRVFGFRLRQQADVGALVFRSEDLAGVERFGLRILGDLAKPQRAAVYESIVIQWRLVALVVRRLYIV